MGRVEIGRMNPADAAQALALLSTSMTHQALADRDLVVEAIVENEEAKTKLFGHASGILLLTPDGRISRYFFGVDYPPSHVRLGLVDASAGKIGIPVDHILLFCYQYDPTKGLYSATILSVIRMGGVITLLCMAIGFVIFRRRDHRAGGNGSPGPVSPAQGAD